MGRSLSFSAVLHVLVALLLIGTFPSMAPELPEIPPAVPVDLVTIGEVTNIKKIDKAEDKPEEPKPEEKPSEPEPEPMRQAALPPEPEPVKEPEPAPAPPEQKPEPKPEEKKVEEKKPEPPKPAAKPKPPAPPKKKEAAFDADKLAALLNKLPQKEKSTTPGEEKQVVTGPQATQAAGAGTEMTATWQALLNEQLKRCWLADGGAMGAENFVVQIHVWLNQDGSLARAPELDNPGAVAAGGPYYQVAAERALRAVQMCQPYQLPPDKYADWRDIIMNFNPRDMLGG